MRECLCIRFDLKVDFEGCCRSLSNNRVLIGLILGTAINIFFILISSQSHLNITAAASSDEPV